MPTVRYSGNGRYRVAGETYEPGDEAEVSEGLASHLVDDVGSFEGVDADAAADDGPDEAAPDIDEWHNWNEDDWLDLGYEQRAADVQAGRVDDHLDEIEAVETSETVTDAVQDRRAELQEG